MTFQRGKEHLEKNKGLLGRYQVSNEEWKKDSNTYNGNKQIILTMGLRNAKEPLPVHGLKCVIGQLRFSWSLTGGLKEFLGWRWRMDVRPSSVGERLDLVVGMSPARCRVAFDGVNDAFCRHECSPMSIMSHLPATPCHSASQTDDD